MPWQLIFLSLGAVVVYISICFGIAKSKRRLDIVDAAWGGSFALVGWLSYLFSGHVPSLITALLVSLWAGRLLVHILRRSRARGDDDPRYRELTAKWHGHIWLRAYGSIFLLQGVLAWLIAMPLMLNSQASQVRWWLWPALVGWLIGWSIEMVADRQLQAFRSRSGTKGKLMQSGLWRYSRHPNYFGELTQWWLIGVIALAAPYGWLGLAGPALLTVLIVFVSGIPPTERRHKNDPAYQAYRRRTSPLIPWPPRPAS